MEPLAIVGIIFGMVTTIGNLIALMLIKFNDMKHLELGFKELKNEVKEGVSKIQGDLVYHGERIARIEGRMCIEVSSKVEK